MKLIRIETDKIYELLQAWWITHTKTGIPRSFLPENTFVCENEGEPIYAICVYNTDSDLCWIGWPVVNPLATEEQKKGCLKFLFEEVEKECKEGGYKVIFTTSGTPAIEHILKQCEFQVGDTGVNHYVKLL